MGKLETRSRLDPQMADAVAMSAKIAEETKRRDGLEDSDPYDVSVLRRLYDADRAYWNEGGPVMAESRDIRIDGPHGEIPLRLHRPKSAPGENAPCLLFIHGGGWVVGNLATHDRMMRILADESGWAVLGIDYRLSPEVKFPVAQDECRAAMDWLRANTAALGIDPDNLAVGGDSAGANMSASLLLGLRDDGALAGVRCGLLFYGAYGLRDSASRRMWGGPEDGLSARDLDFYRDSLMTTRDEMSDPRYDILSNDLGGLPPLLVLEVVLDPLADDSVALKHCAQEAGVAVEYIRADGVLHGYLHMTRMVEAARCDLSRSAAFLKASGA